MGKNGLTDAHRLKVLQAQQRYELWRLGILFVGWVAIVASSWIPLRIFVQVFEALAGKETKVDVSIAIGLTIAISAPAWMLMLFSRTKLREQTKELGRVRTRMAELESDLAKYEDKGG